MDPYGLPTEWWEHPYNYPQPGESCTCRYVPRKGNLLYVGGTSVFEINLECPEHALLYLVGQREFRVQGE